MGRGEGGCLGLHVPRHQVKSTEVVGRGKKSRGGGRKRRRRKLGRGRRVVGRRQGKRRVRLCE